MGSFGLKAIIVAILVSIIGVIIATTVIGDTIDDVNTAVSSVNDSNQCAQAGGYYNGSNTITCQIAAGNLTNAYPGYTTAPLGGLYNTNGVITLMVIGMAFLVVLGMAAKIASKK